MVNSCNRYTPHVIDVSSRNRFEAELANDLKDGHLDKTDVYAYNVGRALKQAFSSNTTLQAMSDGDLRDQITKFHCGYSSGKGVAISGFDVTAFIAQLGGTSSPQTPGGGSSAAPGNGGSTQTPGNGGSSTAPDVDNDHVKTAPGSSLDGDDVKEDDGTNWTAWGIGAAALTALGLASYFGIRGARRKAAAKAEQALVAERKAAAEFSNSQNLTSAQSRQEAAALNHKAGQMDAVRRMDNEIAEQEARIANHDLRQQELDDVFGDPANKAKLDAAEGKVAGHTGGNTSVDDYYAAQGKRYNSATGMYEEIPGYVPPSAVADIPAVRAPEHLQFGAGVESPVNVSRPVPSKPEMLSKADRPRKENVASQQPGNRRDQKAYNRAAENQQMRRETEDARNAAMSRPEHVKRQEAKATDQKRVDQRQTKESVANGGNGYHERRAPRTEAQKQVDIEEQATDDFLAGNKMERLKAEAPSRPVSTSRQRADESLDAYNERRRNEELVDVFWPS